MKPTLLFPLVLFNFPVNSGNIQKGACETIGLPLMSNTPLDFG
jgi:hypothetical protein